MFRFNRASIAGASSAALVLSLVGFAPPAAAVAPSLAPTSSIGEVIAGLPAFCSPPSEVDFVEKEVINDDAITDGVQKDDSSDQESNSSTTSTASPTPSPQPTASADTEESLEPSLRLGLLDVLESVAEPTETPATDSTPSPSTSPSEATEESPSADPSASPSPSPSSSPSPSVFPSASAEPVESWECPKQVGDVRGVGGNNSVELYWSAPANADAIELTNYFVQVISSQRIVTVNPDSTRVVVSGLRNGVEETFVVYAATEHGRSEASQFVTATPSSGMDGEVAGLIVKFTDPESINAGDAAVPGGDKVTSVALSVDAKLTESVHLVELSEAISAEQATEVAEQLQSDPGVQWAEPDVFVFPSARFEVDDPQSQDRQWNLWDEWGLGLPRTSNDATSIDSQAGAGTVVAVIDTGITAHPDLDSQLVPGFDFVSNPEHLAAPRTPGGPVVDFDGDDQPGRDADPTDPGDWRGIAPVRHSTWHGTHIAGVIAAQAGNSEGIAGVAPGAKILPVRALSWRGGLMSDIISSITWASGGKVDGAPANANPADVITLSFTATTQCSVALQSAINDATTRGSILVAAAGNASDDVANYAPANCRNVIAVAATGRDGKRAPYSNHGPGIDISAPGGSLLGDGGVLSTSNAGLQHPETPTYRSGEGTSIAAAHVAAAIARVKSDEPDLTTAQLRARFLNGEQVRAFPDNQCDTDPNIDCGTGILTLAQVASCEWTHPGEVTYNLRVGQSVPSSPNPNLTTGCNSNPFTVVPPFPSGISQHGSGRLNTSAPSMPQETTRHRVTSNSSTWAGFEAFMTITVVGIGPASQTRNAFVGIPMQPTSALTAVFNTAGTTVYSIAPALPAGLEFDAATGVVSGTPTVTHPQTTHTVTGTRGAETYTATVAISSNVLVESNRIVLFDADFISPTRPLTSTLPCDATYSISPALPFGMSLDSSTGVITGRSTAASITSSARTITASCGGNSQTGTVTIVKPGLSPNSALSITGSMGAAISPTRTHSLLAFSNPGSPEYSITCGTLNNIPLPAGLVLDTSTGVISGTPVAPQSALSCRLVATIGDERARVTVNITIGGMQLGTDVLNATVGQSIPTQPTPSAVFTGACCPATTWSINPPLPAGLTLLSSNGRVSGNPSQSHPATAHTITVTRGTESYSATLTVAVRNLLPRNQNLYPRFGEAFGPTPPYETQELEGTPTYSIFGQHGQPAPSWIQIDPTTGAITGTAPSDFAAPTGITSSGMLEVRASDGVTTLTATVNVRPVGAPPAQAQQMLEAEVGTPITPVEIGFQFTDNRGSFTYTVEPALPQGFTVQRRDLGGARQEIVIGGTPASVQPRTTHTVTITRDFSPTDAEIEQYSATLVVTFGTDSPDDSVTSPPRTQQPPAMGRPPAVIVPPVAPPRLDIRPPRIEMPVVSRPDVRRPAVVVVDDEEVELVIERDEQNTGLDATIGDFVLSVGATDTARNRIAPTERRSLVAPVRGWIDVKATGYAPRSVVGLYLVPQMAPRFLPRFGFEPFFLGEAVVDDDQLIVGEFRIPDWAAAGEYALQINGFTPAGALKSINMRLDLIDQRSDAVSAARACVFPESTVRLTPECRRSLRSLKDLLPDEIDTLTIDITGVAYAQENRRANRAVALERAERIRQFLRRNDIGGEVSVGVVVRRNMAPGLSLLPPPPVVVAENGKPASTVVLTVEWTTEVGPDGASLR